MTGLPNLPLSGGDRPFGVSPSFLDALGEAGAGPLRAQPGTQPAQGQPLTLAHGTTIIGLKFDAGVVKARRHAERTVTAGEGQIGQAGHSPPFWT